MKQLLITGCSDSQYWYAGLVGTRQKYAGETDDFYWSRESAGYINIIKKTDATIVESTNEH